MISEHWWGFDQGYLKGNLASLGTASCEVQEGHVWETLGAPSLSEVTTFILGGNEVILALGASCGPYSFLLPMGLGVKPSGGV